MTRVDVTKTMAFVYAVLVLVGVGAVMVIVEAVETPLKTVIGAGVSVATVVEVAKQSLILRSVIESGKKDKRKSHKLLSAW